MPDYRLYYLDNAGHIGKATELDCSNDDEAVAAAARLEDGRAMELWDRARMVRRFAAKRLDA